jgi:serine/threonine protein kinase/tetratricopeptide (TPR) repeat protein
VKTSGKRVCRVCGAQFPSTSDFCPACLLRGAVEEESLSGALVNSTDTPANLRLDHYEILLSEDGRPVELGHGAMGVTYKAIDVNLRCPVALKIIGKTLIGDENACRRFVREARAAAGVRDPHVASVFHLGRCEHNYFYAMELVDGEALDQLIHRLGRLTVSDALKILRQVTTGLEALWKQNLVHRDIKPGNIMVCMEADRIVCAKIIDLGLAKGGTEEEGSATISTRGSFVGTAAYASPEQFAGLPADIRSDLYSLGITFWEMLSGKLPFEGTSSELMYSHQSRVLPLKQIAQMPPPTRTLLLVLLEKDPAARFQNPTELLRAITMVTEAISSGKSLAPAELRRPGNQYSTQERTARKIRFHRQLQTFRKALPRAVGIASLLLLICLISAAVYHGFDSKIADRATSLTDKSIAVLPFESLSGNREDTYFADGVQEEILNSLARIAHLKVISRTSLMQYRPDSQRDLRQIARALGVTNVLEGTVRRNGNRMRVATELIDAVNDNTIWADTYDRDLTDMFAIQGEVAQTIASKLNAALSPDERKSIETKPTDSLRAYDLYLKAKLILADAEARWDTGPLQAPLHEALDLLDQAIQLDPKFALAYCASATAHDFLYLLYDQTLERRALADTAVNNALRLQPELPEVHLEYGYHLYRAYHDHEGARAQVAIAKRALPNSTEITALEARIDRSEGKFEKAILEFNDALIRDPLNAGVVEDLALSYFYLRRFREAEQTFGRLARLSPEQPMIKVQKTCLIDFMEKGESKAIESVLSELPKGMADDRAVLSLQLAFAVTDGELQRAKGLIERFDGGDDEGYFGYAGVPVPIGCYAILIARLQGNQQDAKLMTTRQKLNQKVLRCPANAELLSTLAVIDALLGDRDKALEEAQRATEMKPVAKDAMAGPAILQNVAVVHAWTGELERAFAELSSAAKMPKGISYGELKLEQFWVPLRNDPRYEKLLAELAPKD